MTLNFFNFFFQNMICFHISDIFIIHGLNLPTSDTARAPVEDIPQMRRRILSTAAEGTFGPRLRIRQPSVARSAFRRRKGREFHGGSWGNTTQMG